MEYVCRYIEYEIVTENVLILEIVKKKKKLDKNDQ